MARTVQQFLKCRAAATSIEYAIIAGSLSIVIVVAANSIGTKLNGIFSSVANAVK
ncbi:MAG TPA: Flp family type IVb pilin [Xanthobacteraceae bacterium]